MGEVGAVKWIALEQGVGAVALELGGEVMFDFAQFEGDYSGFAPRCPVSLELLQRERSDLWRSSSSETAIFSQSHLNCSVWGVLHGCLTRTAPSREKRPSLI